jgi:hypothetical protein
MMNSLVQAVNHQSIISQSISNQSKSCDEVAVGLQVVESLTAEGDEQKAAAWATMPMACLELAWVKLSQTEWTSESLRTVQVQKTQMCLGAT